jgi:hypothetical protein
MFINERPASSGEKRTVTKQLGPPLAASGAYTRHPGRDAASGSDDDVNRHAVLVFSSDPLAAALLGAAIELAGHAPSFPLADESARDALLRVRPRLSVIDCDHEEACSDSFIGPALMTGSRVLLFKSRRTERDASELASRLGLTVVDMPARHETLTQLLRELVA